MGTIRIEENSECKLMRCKEIAENAQSYNIKSVLSLGVCIFAWFYLDSVGAEPTVKTVIVIFFSVPLMIHLGQAINYAFCRWSSYAWTLTENSIKVEGRYSGTMTKENVKSWANEQNFNHSGYSLIQIIVKKTWYSKEEKVDILTSDENARKEITGFLNSICEPFEGELELGI